jgi:N-acyl-D-aspartate/D-glutamate deacylase
MTQNNDILIRGAKVVDGTGIPEFSADIEVRDGRITRIGRSTGIFDGRVIDADGLYAVPGFIDVHTHYEAQLNFEPSASPSSWHGVTTVVTGNCGFSVAPAKTEDLPWLTHMLAKVEGMSSQSLELGVKFKGGSVADFLAILDGNIGVNMAYYVAHSAIRRWVMGSDASERTATEWEIALMAELVDTGMRQGAIGFSTSQLDLHADHEGKPIPSNVASSDEIVALCAVLARYPEGIVEHLPRSFAMGYDDSDRKLLREIAIASGIKPVHVNSLLRFTNDPEIWRECMTLLEQLAADGLRVYPMASANPKGLHISLSDTGMLDEMPTFREVLAKPHTERVRLLRDHATREQLRKEYEDESIGNVKFTWAELIVVGVDLENNRHRVGRTLAELSAEDDVDPFDLFLDLSLEEDLKTVFLIDRPVTAEDRDVIRHLLAHPQTTPGSSDGGAHVNTFCGADYPTRILTEYVDDNLTFEWAIRKLTAVPAATLGIPERGQLQLNTPADIVLLDRERLGVGPARFVNDFPGGSGRLVFDAIGYHATIVNGTPLVVDGEWTGETPGSVLRFNQAVSHGSGL